MLILLQFHVIYVDVLVRLLLLHRITYCFITALFIMVKNSIGGKKAKGMARKNMRASATPATRALRISQNENEVYAQATKMLGNCMFIVKCADGVSRLCYIRGKFRGKNKRDNTVTVGAWVLVGLREWNNDAASQNVQKSGKKNDKNDKKSHQNLQESDLLELYTAQDVEQLKVIPNVNWKIFTATTSAANPSHSRNIHDDDIEFSNTAENDYNELMQDLLKKNADDKSLSFVKFSSQSHNTNATASNTSNVRCMSGDSDDNNDETAAAYKSRPQSQSQSCIIDIDDI